MTFGTDWGWGASESESAKQFELFAEAGGTLIDTANRYTNGSAGTILGDLLAADRDHFVVGTKYSLNTRDGDLDAGGNHRKNLVQALEASLRRLRTDHVDVLWLHAWDYLTPPEEVMRALDDQVRLGKVLYLGVSDTPAWVVAQLQTLAAVRGWSTFAGPRNSSPTTSPALTPNYPRPHWPASIKPATSPAASRTTSWPAPTSCSAACRTAWTCPRAALATAEPRCPKAIRPPAGRPVPPAAGTR